MLDGENLIGVILLALCVITGGVLIYAIVTGTRFVWTGPGWVAPVLMILFIGGGIYGFLRAPGRRWRLPWERDK
ncbi:MAG: hypothetical protein QM692_13075 [Thermomicrobiales bacterium]